MIQAKFGLNWPSGFREDFWKSLQTDAGCQVMAIAHRSELKIKAKTVEHKANHAIKIIEYFYVFISTALSK